MGDDARQSGSHAPLEWRVCECWSTLIDTQLEICSWLRMANMRRADCRKAPMARYNMMRRVLAGRLRARRTHSSMRGRKFDYRSKLHVVRGLRMSSCIMATTQIAAPLMNGIARPHIWPRDTQIEGHSWLRMANMRRADCRKAPMARYNMMRRVLAGRLWSRLTHSNMRGSNLTIGQYCARYAARARNPYATAHGTALRAA